MKKYLLFFIPSLLFSQNLTPFIGKTDKEIANVSHQITKLDVSFFEFRGEYFRKLAEAIQECGVYNNDFWSGVELTRTYLDTKTVSTAMFMNNRGLQRNRALVDFEIGGVPGYYQNINVDSMGVWYGGYPETVGFLEHIDAGVRKSSKYDSNGNLVNTITIH